MSEEPTQTPEFNALIGFILGLLGVIGTAIWYFNGNDATGGATLGSGFAVALGIISFVVLLWASLTIFFLIRSSRDNQA